MGHYAKVLDGKVVNVIVAEENFFLTFVDTSPGKWIKTSYNTLAGVHYDKDGNKTTDTPLRGNYAGIGYVYDQTNDVFYPLSPYPSWILNKNTWSWEPPIAMPVDGKVYNWDERTQSWYEIVMVP